MIVIDANAIVDFISSEHGVALLINIALLLFAMKPVKRKRNRTVRQRRAN